MRPGVFFRYWLVWNFHNTLLLFRHALEWLLWSQLIADVIYLFSFLLHWNSVEHHLVKEENKWSYVCKSYFSAYRNKSIKYFFLLTNCQYCKLFRKFWRRNFFFVNFGIKCIFIKKIENNLLLLILSSFGVPLALTATSIWFEIWK